MTNFLGVFLIQVSLLTVAALSFRTYQLRSTRSAASLADRVSVSMRRSPRPERSRVSASAEADLVEVDVSRRDSGSQLPEEDLEAHRGLADAGSAAHEQDLAASPGGGQRCLPAVVRLGTGDALRRPSAAAFPHQPGHLARSARRTPATDREHLAGSPPRS
jgi:hypothetical protein